MLKQILFNLFLFVFINLVDFKFCLAVNFFYTLILTLSDRILKIFSKNFRVFFRTFCDIICFIGVLLCNKFLKTLLRPQAFLSHKFFLSSTFIRFYILAISLQNPTTPALQFLQSCSVRYILLKCSF